MMTNHLNLFAPIARIALPTFSVGPIKYAHKVRRRVYSGPPVLDKTFAAIEDGILPTDMRRSAATRRGPSIGSIAPPDAWIERPSVRAHKTRLRSIRLQIGPAPDLRRDLCRGTYLNPLDSARCRPPFRDDLGPG